MKKLKSIGSQPIVGGVQMGHLHLHTGNHASGGAYVAMPIKQNVANIMGRRAKASRPAIESINPKGQK